MMLKKDLLLAIKCHTMAQPIKKIIWAYLEKVIKYQCSIFTPSVSNLNANPTWAIIAPSV